MFYIRMWNLGVVGVAAGRNVSKVWWRGVVGVVVMANAQQMSQQPLSDTIKAPNNNNKQSSALIPIPKPIFPIIRVRHSPLGQSPARAANEVHLLLTW